jgi:hypothetical protein
LAQLAIACAEPRRYAAALQHVASASISDRSIEPWKRLLQAGHLATLIKQSDVERLHAHFAHGSTHVAMLASMLTGLPFSFSAHARDIYNNASPRLLREKMRAAEMVVTCTRANQEHLQSMMPALDRDKIKLAYHGADLAKFSLLAGARRRSATAHTFGRPADPKKGFRTCCSAAPAARQGLPVPLPDRRRAGRATRCRSAAAESVVSLLGACKKSWSGAMGAPDVSLPCKVLANGDRDGIERARRAMHAGSHRIDTGVRHPRLIEQPERAARAARQRSRAGRGDRVCCATGSCVSASLAARAPRWRSDSIQ